jgi:maspardin
VAGLELSAEDPTVAAASSFMAERLEQLPQSVLASRLAINCAPAAVRSEMLTDLPTTIIDSWDSSALSHKVRLNITSVLSYARLNSLNHAFILLQVKEELIGKYPHAKLAHLKTGGNFPFLSRSDEVNMHIMVGI